MINKKAKFRIYFSLIFIALFFFWAFWFVFSENTIMNIIEEIGENHSLQIVIKGLKKGIIYNLFIDEIIVRSEYGEIMTLNKVKSKINPFKLLMKNLDMSVEGESGNGRIKGFIEFAKNNAEGKLEFRDIDLDALSFLRRTKIRGSGNISGSFTFNNRESHIEFICRNLSLADIEVSGIKTPTSYFHSMSGAINVSKNSINIESISFDGKNIYARIKGYIKDYIADTTLEIMPDRNFTENPFILAGLEQYKVSPGYYLIPLKGEVLF